MAIALFWHTQKGIIFFNKYLKSIRPSWNKIYFFNYILSLSCFYGNEVKKVALKLLDEGQIDFLASDVNNQNQIKAINSVTLNNNTLDQVTLLL